MTNALTLTASSLGRASQPSGSGAVLYVDGDNAVTIDAWPQPSRWIPDGVQLFRGDEEIRAPQPGDEWRWVLTGDERFGVFRAVARAGQAAVESAPMVVQPTPVTVLAGAAEDVPGPHVRPSRAVGSGFSDDAAPGTAAGAGLGSSAGWPGGSAWVESGATGPGSAGTPSPNSDSSGLPAPSPSGPPAGGARGAGAGRTGQPYATGGLGAVGFPAGPESGGRPWPGPPTSDASSPQTPLPAGPSGAPLPGGASVRSPAPQPVPSGPRTPAHASAADIAAMIEIPRGEFDGRFAALVGALFTVVSAGVIWYAATRLLGDPDLFATSTPPAEAVPPDAPAPFVRPANVADRIGLGTSTMVLALGVVVILAGASLAALEVRARMLRRDRGGAGDSTSGGPSTPGSAPHRGTTARGTPGALRQVAVIIDRISQPRAVVAVLVTGGSLVLVGFFGQLHWALRL